MKKGAGLFLGFVLLISFLLPIVSAEKCYITSSGSCTSEYTVLRLSSSTNAHAGTYTSSYDYALCCDFTESYSHMCSGSNGVLRLSSTTNAHAEVSSNYDYLVCFADLSSCRSATSCSTGEINVVNLTATTNAHIDPNGATKICCSRGGTTPEPEPGEVSLEWAEDTFPYAPITEMNYYGETLYSLGMAYNGYGTGDNFEFCISTYYWGGWLPVSPYCLGGGSGGGQDLNGDGVMDSYSGIAIGDKLNDDDTEFYFTFGDLTSPTLTVHNYYVEPPEPTLVWMDNDMFYEVSSDDYALVDLPFKLVAYDYSGSENFDVYVKKYLGEIDELAADELVLENVVGTFGNLDGDSNTDKYASVTLTEEMLDGDETEFYFKVGNYESSILTVSDLSGTCEDGVCDEGEIESCPEDCDSCNNNGECEPGLGESSENCADCVPVDDCAEIGICGDYINELDCNDDSCGVATLTPPPAGEGNVDRCYWNEDTESCEKAITTTTSDGQLIGSCSTSREQNEDNCEDGFLDYSWTASVNWAVGNSFASLEDCEAYSVDCGVESCFEEGGVWRCDPAGLQSSCVDGSEVVACPAQIQLNFFDWKNLVAVVALVFVVYLLLRKDRKKLRMEVPSSKKIRRTKKK